MNNQYESTENSSTPTLLLADDDLMFRIMLSRALGNHGYKILVAENGQEAVDVFNREEVDIVLLDADMPDMDGFAACKLISDQNEDMPVLIVTASDDHAFIDKAFAAGAADYIQKPIHHQLLQHRLDYLLNVAQQSKHLHHSEILFRSLFEDAPIAYQSLNKDGEIINVNQAWATMLGYDNDAVIGQTFTTFIEDSFKADFVERFQQGKLDNASDLQLQLLKKDQQPVDVELKSHASYDPKGNITLTRSTLINITERKQREEEMLKLTSALDQAGNSVIITDLNGRIQYVNKEFTSITGYFLDDVIGRNPSILQSGKQDKCFYVNMWKTILADGEWMGDLQNKRKDGQLYVERLHIRALHDTNGNRVNYVGVFSDITEQLEMEARYRQSQKMAALGTLVGGVAHNFNNMLAGIVGRSYLARMHCEQDDISNALLELEGVENIGMRAGEMIHKLLAFARKGVSRKETTDINSLMNEAIDVAKLGLSALVELEVNICSLTMMAYADSNQLQQTIINLINNARDAVAQSPSKKITVSLQYVDANHLDEPFRQQHPHVKAEHLALIQIKDSGKGIDEEQQKKIFDPFFTTKDVGAGTGLGLSMAMGVSEDHGGAIEVKSQKGKGALFSLWMPLSSAPDQPSQAIHNEVEIVESIADEVSLLLVDDDDMIRNMAACILEKKGFNVIVAKDGQEAVEIFVQHQENIKIVISDIVMPHLDGPSSVAKMREYKPQLPVIFITGYDKGSVNINEQEKAITMVSTKPFKIAELNQSIKTLLKDK
ncbi:MAG: response regulator [Mariprofundales bacterium]